MKQLYYCGINNYQQCPSEIKAQPKIITKLTHVLNDEVIGLDYSNRILVVQNDHVLKLFGMRYEFDNERFKMLNPPVKVDHFISTEDFIYIEKSLSFWKSDYSNTWTEVNLNFKNQESEKLWNDETNTSIKKLSKTSNGIFCLLSNGKVWRLGTDGELGLSYSAETDAAIDIASGFEHLLVLTESGCVLSFGIGSRGQLGHGDLNSLNEPLQISNLIGFKIIKIAAGGWHSCAITDTGDLYVWGWNNFGQLGYPAEDEKDKEGVGLSAEPIAVDFQDEIQDVSCGSRHTVIMTANGDLHATGWNDYGQLGTGTVCKVSKFSHIKVGAKGNRELICGPWSTMILETSDTKTRRI